MRFVAYAGSEKQPIARSGVVVVAKAQRPQSIVLDRMSAGVAEEAVEASAVGVINGDLPAAGVADQQMAGEEAETRRGNGHTPGRSGMGARII